MARLSAEIPRFGCELGLAPREFAATVLAKFGLPTEEKVNV